MLYSDTPARIPAPGTHSLATAVGAVYTVGRDHVLPAMRDVFSRTREVACDIETYGLGKDTRRVKVVSFSDDRHAVLFDPRDPQQATMIRQTFEHAEGLFFHNSPYDVPNLYLNGLITSAQVDKVSDTLIWSRLADPGEMVRKSLLAAGNRYLETHGSDVLLESFRMLGLTKKDGFRTYDLDRPIYAQGAASDPLITYRLAQVLPGAAYRRLTQGHPFGHYGVTGDEAWRLVEREQRMNRLLLRRSCAGFRVDFDYLDQYRETNAREVAEAEAELAALGIRRSAKGAFNGQDLARVLDKLGALPADFPRTEKTQQPSMTAKNVERLEHPVARKFVRAKQIDKVGTDYLGKVVDLSLNGRVHPTVNLLAAATGRMSMGDPPLQQFSGPARGILLADKGDSMVSIDWSQIEPVTMANVAKDTKVLAGYDSGGEKLYDTIARLGKIEYKEAKVVLLAQMYGEGLEKLTRDLGLDPGPYIVITDADDWRVRFGKAKVGDSVPTFAAAQALRRAVFAAMPESEKLIGKLKHIAVQYRKVFTVSGRILDVPVQYGRVMAHKGVNYFCQGGAYDVMAEAVIRCEEAGLGPAIYLAMHDELVVSKDAAEDVRRIMETPPERLCFLAGRTPVLRTDLAELGERWADA